MSDDTVTIKVSKEAVNQFFQLEELLADAMGCASDDVYEICAEGLPRAQEVTDALVAVLR